MRTAYRDLTPEQKETIKQKQRQKYAALSSEQKQERLVKQREYQENLSPEQREIRSTLRRVTSKPVPTYSMLQDDGSRRLINPAWNSLVYRLDKRITRHQEQWLKKCYEIQDWQKAGGLFPWPNMKKKMEFTELWLKITLLLGRQCCQCGRTNQFDFNWRLTRKDDFLAFVPAQKRAYEYVLRHINDYQLYCLWCALDLKLFTFAWIFSPYSPRNNSNPPTCNLAGEKYDNWHQIWPEMYPSGYQAIAEKINSGKIRSLTCSYIGLDGQRKPSILRKNQFYGYVGSNPRPCEYITMSGCAEYVKQQGLPYDTTYWGYGVTSHPYLGKIGINYISDDIKKFLEGGEWLKQK